MNKPKISVITVVFNMKDKMEANIKNVLEQDYENVEFVVIDGGSTDGTMDVVNKFRKEIDIVVSEPDKGIYDAMNKGQEKATGDYVHFLNVGDLFTSKNVLSRVAKVLKEGSPDFMYGNVMLVNYENGYRSRSSKKINLNLVKRGRKLIQQAVVMKRSLLESIGGFSLEYKLSADYDMYAKVFKATESIVYADIDIVDFDMEGASSDMTRVYSENAKIVSENFGGWWSIRYWVLAQVKIFGTKVFGLIGGKWLIDLVRMILGR